MGKPAASGSTRRDFLRLGGLVAVASAMGATALAQNAPVADKLAVPVSPTEDLMREHGVLSRLLLIYENQTRRLEAGQDIDPQVLSGASKLIRGFVEDYHEKLEEDYVFPRFEKAGKMADLVGLLRTQHRAGRGLTDAITGVLAAGRLNAGDRLVLGDAMRLFIRMYRPHKAREDTVLFPALRQVVTPKEWDGMGELFEDKENQLFGPNGFERVVGEVAELERRLGIYELAQFTPPASDVAK